MSVKVDPYYARINAIGAISLACATLIAGMYLLISIGKQGHGKLRVRLLLGMVASDLVLGAIVLPPEIAYIAGRPFMTDTATCVSKPAGSDIVVSRACEQRWPAIRRSVLAVRRGASWDTEGPARPASYG